MLVGSFFVLVHARRPSCALARPPGPPRSRALVRWRRSPMPSCALARPPSAVLAIDAAALVVLCARPPVTHAPAYVSVLRGPRSCAVTGDMLACWPPHAAARVRSPPLVGSACTRACVLLLHLIWLVENEDKRAVAVCSFSCFDLASNE